MMMTAMSNGLIDAVVIVCEGCGTVLLDEPEMVQGIGGRVSGLVSTTPITELIKRLGPEKVLDPETAKVDQAARVKKAIYLGYRTVILPLHVKSPGCKAAPAMGAENPGVNLYIFVVHT